MKIRVFVDPGSDFESTLIERDTTTGRDLNVFTAEPSDAYEFELRADTIVFAQRGRRVSDDGDGGGGGGPAVGTGRKLEGITGLATVISEDDYQDGIAASAATAADAAAAAAAAAAPSGADSQAGTEPPPKLEPTEASDAEIRVIMATLESEPSVERTQGGAIQVTTINKALEARNYKPITAAKRDELAAPPPAA